MSLYAIYFIIIRSPKQLSAVENVKTWINLIETIGNKIYFIYPGYTFSGVPFILSLLEVRNNCLQLKM